jgi:hypothetical protein
MLTLEDCIAPCDPTEEEVEAIADHEPGAEPQGQGKAAASTG